MKAREISIVIGLLIASMLFLVACDGETEIPVTQEVPVTREVEPIDVAGLVEEIRGKYEEGANCVVSPDGSGFASMGGGFASMGGSVYFFLDEEQFHGDYVYATVADSIDMLKTSRVGFDNGLTDEVAILVIDHFDDMVVPTHLLTDTIDYNGVDIHLVQVNIDAFDTAVVTQRTSDAIANLQSLGVERFVLNMSWIIVPCTPAHLEDVAEYIVNFCTTEIAEDLGDFGARMAQHTDLEESMYDFCEDKHTIKRAIENITRKEYFYALNGDLPSWFDILENDPFYQFIACYLQEAEPGFQPGQENDFLGDMLGGIDFAPELNCDPDTVIDPTLKLIPVAAAGNSALSSTHGAVTFPFFPAILDGILSVSAADGSNLAHYSNHGEVRIEDSSTLKYEGDVLEGTSFSAPRISALNAVFLAQGFDHTMCQNLGGIPFANIYPPLGYMSEQGGGGFENLPIPTAVDNYCTTFPLP